MHKRQTKIRWWLLVATAIAAIALPALAGAATPLSRGGSIGPAPVSRGGSIGRMRLAPMSVRVANGQFH